jgi:RNA polymerase sigma-70 factor (ECF subfamily)
MQKAECHVNEDSGKLVEEAQRGERAAIDALLERHLPGLRAFVRLRAGEQVRAQESVSDLVQSVCREALEDVGSFRYQGEAAFKHWLFTLALRKIVDRSRRLRVRPLERAVAAGAAAGIVSGQSELLEHYATFCTPSADAAIREEVERIERAFDALGEDDREVITLARLVGLRYAEIGERMGRSEEAVRKLLARALARLGRRLRA